METAADRLLIEAYAKHMSVEEAAEYSGIAPDLVAQRTIDALGLRDYLGEAARIELLMRKLEDMASEIQTRLPDMSDRNVSAAVNAAAGAMGRVLGQLTKIQASNKLTEKEMEESYARRFADMIDAAYQRRRGQLEALYPNLTPEEHEEGFRDTILELAREADAQ